MAVETFRTRSPKGKLKMVSFRTVCKLVWDNPFIVAMLLFLICLHRYFPFLFSLLLSFSPVLVCAAVLLGTLLIYGQPNDTKVVCCQESNTIESPRNREMDSRYFNDKDGNSPQDRFAEVRKDIVEKAMKVSGTLGAGIRACDNEAVGWESCNSELKMGSEVHWEKSKAGFRFRDFENIDVQTSKVQDQNLVDKFDKSLQVKNDHGTGNHLNSSPNQQKHVDAATDHESTDSESDGADKSSLDALVADVIPTPLETLPLLDSEDPLLPHPSHDVSPKSELQSLGSNQSSGDSYEEADYRDEEGEDEIDDDETPKAKDGVKSTMTWTADDQKIFQELNSSEMEKNEHLENLLARINDIRDREEEEGEEEVEASEDDDDDEIEEVNLNAEKGGSQHVTMWTEEDEKNLRDLGSSELERNQRLENLLSRRRAQRNFSMISERNLIDLDHSDIPIQVAPISTTRANPFDVPDDSSTHHTVPPVPGSAPSITVPRKNPFDSPCTSPKGTHNITLETPKEESRETNPNNSVSQANVSSSTGYNPVGDPFKPDFLEINRKDAMFRRYESFNTGYNFMGDASSQDFIEVDRRDAVFSRHVSFSTRPVFHGVSTSVKRDGFHLKPLFVPEQAAVEEERHPSLERQSSQDSESTVSSGSGTESSVAPDHEDVEPDQETELASELYQDGDSSTVPYHVSSHSESGSESSKVGDSLQDHQDEHFAADSDVNPNNSCQETEAIDENHDVATSSSMSSEGDEKSPNIDQVVEEEARESGLSPSISLEVSEANHMRLEEEHNHIEPVYDTSPGAEKKLLSFDAAHI